MFQTIFFIVLTSIVSIIAFSNRQIFDKLKFNAYMVIQRKEYGRLFGHALLHADWMHLIVNMFVLYMFGQSVEQFFKAYMPGGGFLYVLMYLLAVPAATIPALIKQKNNHSYNSVGASGAVAAVLFASILINPEGRVAFLFVPIPIPNPIFGILYLAYSYFMDKRGNDNVAHDAHFAGAVFGFIFPILFEPRLIILFFSSVLHMSIF